jgi:hypothetical protein
MAEALSKRLCSSGGFAIFAIMHLYLTLSVEASGSEESIRFTLISWLSLFLIVRNVNLSHSADLI